MAAKEENLILVVNCSKCVSSEDIIKQTLDKELLPPQKIAEVIDCFPWRIENKYYSADVKFLAMKDKEPGPNWLLVQGKTIDAFLIVFDQTESFELVKQWLPCVELKNASVLLLVGLKHERGVKEDLKPDPQVFSRLQVIEWCIKNSFEFIDLNEEADPEDDFSDTVGFDRIVQALQTTEWSCLQMKGAGSESSLRTPQLNEEARGTTDEKDVCLGGNSSTLSTSESQTTEDHSLSSDLDKLDDMFDGVTEAELNDEASFEQLFSQMKTMKDKAQSLPHQERQAYAEQVAVAFWRAIGGDEEELDGLNESTEAGSH